MDSETLTTLLDALPKYISLFYPGYITMYLYFFFEGRNFKDSSWGIAKAVFISYFYNVLSKEIMRKMGYSSDFALNILLVIISAITGIIAAKIKDSKIFEKILETIKGDTVFRENEFEILRNEDRSAWVCIYIKNTNLVYEGSLREVNLESKNEKYICLSGYYKYKINERGKPILPYILNLADNNEEKVVIRYSDIAMIEKRDTTE